MNKDELWGVGDMMKDELCEKLVENRKACGSDGSFVGS